MTYYIAAKWSISPVYELMILQMTLPLERFITHITAKW
jgi:hypothetical protein